MTSATQHARDRYRDTSEPPRPHLSWTMIGVLFAAATAAGAAIAEHATLDDRVSHLEQEVPPGAWRVLDERTLRMQKDLDHLVGRN